MQGVRYHARPVVPDDKALLLRGFEHLSEESRYFRFLSHQHRLTDRQLEYFTEVDGVNHIAWGILDVSGAESEPVGIGRFIRMKEEAGSMAEVAYTIVDAYQRRGLGGILLAVLNLAAAEVGIRRFRYCVLSENHFVIDQLRLVGIENIFTESSMICVDTRVFRSHGDLPEKEGLRNYREAFKLVERQMLNGAGPHLHT